MDQFIVYYINTYSQQEDLFNHIEQTRPCFKLLFDKKLVGLCLEMFTKS